MIESNIEVKITVPNVDSIKLTNTEIISINVSKDILSTYDNFSIELINKDDSLLNLLVIGSEVVIKFDGIFMLQGYIEDVKINHSRSTNSLSISGRDLLGIFTDITLSPEFKISENNTYADAIKKAIQENIGNNLTVLFKLLDSKKNKTSY